MNPFATDEMAAGYAAFRPPVHPRVMERVRASLARPLPCARALDVGCGAGVSTKALAGFARTSIGLEPAERMLKWARSAAKFATFVAGRAEAIPMLARSIDLMTAAGSLNYVDLDHFFPEAARVLAPEGVLVVYDFSAGSSFRGSTALDEWFEEFSRRYPAPPGEGRSLSPEILAELDSGFRLQSREHFEIGLTLTPGFYLDYILTETNVAAAIRSGMARREIRSWCAETLEPVWRRAEHEVIFRGYFACMIAK